MERMPVDAAWSRIRDLFERGLELDEPARSAFLRMECGGDADLLKRVAGLIASHDKANTGFLSKDMPVKVPPPVFTTGQIVAGRFEIRRFLDRGGMGEVYEAWDERLRAKVALKTIRPEFAADAGILERFQREIRVAREVVHDRLCRVYELVEHSDPASPAAGPRGVITCLTMQLLEGETLQAFLEREGPLDAHRALPLIRDIASALEALHQKGLVHRDLKPGNIMLVREGDAPPRAVVMDFGLTKPLNITDDWFQSRTDLQAGAPYYMAPEQLRNERVTTASDIYSFGLVIDEMVTRSRAFPADSLEGLYYQRLKEQPVPPGQRAENLPEVWERVILKCLDQREERRFKRPADVVAALEGGDLSGTLRLPAVPHVVPAGAMAPSSTRRIWLTSVLALAILAPAVALASWLRRPLDTSLQVFPVTVLSLDHDYLGKGIGVEMVRRLSQLKGLRVIPVYEHRDQVKGKAVGRFQLDAHLRPMGGKVRLTPQLTDSDGTVLWSDNFEEDPGDPQRLEEAACDAVVHQIEKRVLLAGIDAAPAQYVGAALLPARKLFGFQLPARATNNAAAFDHYIRGRHLWDERTLASALAAIDQYEKALKEDPGFALAYAALADAQYTLMEYKHAPHAELLERARRYAEQAVALGPGLAESHLAKAGVEQMSYRWPEAEESFRRALALNPKFSRARRWYAGMVMQFGRYDDGLREARQALDADPFDYPGQAAVGMYEFFAGAHQQAVERLEETLRNKELLYARQYLGWNYARMSQLASGDEARQYLEKAQAEARRIAVLERGQSYPEHSEYLTAICAAIAGNQAEARTIAGRMKAQWEAGHGSAANVAVVHALGGDHAKALDLLEAAARDNDRGLMYVKVHPFLEKLRTETRFRNILSMLRL